MIIGNNNEIALPDEFCEELNIEIGDILLCERVAGKDALSLRKFSNQSLSDEEVQQAGNLTRVYEVSDKNE